MARADRMTLIVGVRVRVRVRVRVKVRVNRESPRRWRVPIE